MLEMELPPDPPDLYLYPSIEECAHRAWDWAYEVVQFNADDPENPTYEEHRQAHSLTISLLAHHLWTSIGIVPDNDRIQNLIDLIQVGWFRYARGKLIEHTHILEEEGLIDPIDEMLKLATRGTMYQEEEMKLTTDDTYDDVDPDDLDPDFEPSDIPPYPELGDDDEFDEGPNSHGDNGAD